MSSPYPSNMKCPNCGRPNVYYIWQSKQYVAKCYNCGQYITADEMRSEFAKATTPQTNADRIRSMTDEELANILNFMFVAYDFRNPADILEWLRQEADA